MCVSLKARHSSGLRAAAAVVMVAVAEAEKASAKDCEQKNCGGADGDKNLDGSRDKKRKTYDNRDIQWNDPSAGRGMDVEQ